MCASTAENVTMNVNESDDGSWDFDTPAITRTIVEDALAQNGCTVTTLSNSLYETYDAWHEFRNELLQESVVDYIEDLAETD